jgi:hypothetical protein
MRRECPEGLTFYDLRPSFVAEHYAREPLSPSLAAHLDSCEACRMKWDFLVKTDPQLAARYKQEVKVLVRQIEELESVPAAQPQSITEEDWSYGIAHQEITPMDKAIRELTLSPSPDFKQIRDCWLSIREILDEHARHDQSQYLVQASDYVLKRENVSEMPLLNKFMVAVEAYRDPVSRRVEPVEFDSVQELLFLTRIPFTSFITKLSCIDFASDKAGRFKPEDFVRSEELYEQYLRQHSPEPATL